METFSQRGPGPLATHQIENQPPPLENYNAYESDRTLQDSVKHSDACWADKELREFGGLMGQKEIIHDGFLANQNRPVFRSHDRYGHRIDHVEFHPAYHNLFRLSVKYGIHSLPWATPKPGSHAARAALLYLAYQVDQGHICPVTMTYGCVPSLQNQTELADRWLPKLFSREYDPGFQPVDRKTGATIGMAMTEKQGGSDVRANTTQARAINQPGPGQEYLLTGHKWFCSAPMCDAFLMLAQTNNGPSCFFVPRWRPDGTKNNIFIQRLKDKLGDHSNASSEIELQDTWGVLVGEEGRGVPIIIEMANYTRIDCGTAAAALMRQGVVQALHHTAHRKAFGALLIGQPIMQNVLADLVIESEAATRLALRIASAYDHQDDAGFQGPFRRIATAASKYWLTKRSITHTSESMEVLGGSGYVEENIMARLYRQAPLNSIWEGSGNIMCLDVLRALQKEPATAEALLQELSLAQGADKNYDQHIGRIKDSLCRPQELIDNARHFTGQIALALQAGLMLRYSDSTSAALFCQTRLAGDGPGTIGTLPNGVDFRKIIEPHLV